jgi:hypothetical protein
MVSIAGIDVFRSGALMIGIGHRRPNDPRCRRRFVQARLVSRGEIEQPLPGELIRAYRERSTTLDLFLQK